MTFEIRPRRSRSLLAALLVGTAIAAAGIGLARAQDGEAKPANPDEVVVTVNDFEITQGDVQMAVGDLAGVLRQVPPDKHGDYIISFLIDIALVSKQAEADGLEDDPEFKRALAFAREKALVQAKLSDVGEAAVTDEAIKARYEEAIKDFESKEEVRARHILVASEEEAKSIKAELDGGASFEEMAQKHSKDNSSQNGGDLGYFSKEMMVEPFGETAFALEVGGVSDPIQTQFGWHIIKLEDKRMSAPPPLEEVRDEIARELTQKARREYIESLRADAQILRKDGTPFKMDEAKE